MRPFEKFLNDSLGTKELLEIYLELRKHFQEIGFSEADLVDPPTYTNGMFMLQKKFQSSMNALLYQVNAYGFEVSRVELGEYIQPLLKKINELTPLSENGYHEGGNQGDEDFE
jgi:hypothetical protein